MEKKGGIGWEAIQKEQAVEAELREAMPKLVDVWWNKQKTEKLAAAINKASALPIRNNSPMMKLVVEAKATLGQLVAEEAETAKKEELKSKRRFRRSFWRCSSIRTGFSSPRRRVRPRPVELLEHHRVSSMNYQLGIAQRTFGRRKRCLLQCHYLRLHGQILVGLKSTLSKRCPCRPLVRLAMRKACDRRHQSQYEPLPRSHWLRLLRVEGLLPPRLSSLTHR